MKTVTVIFAAMLVISVITVITVNGQITTPCTVSQIASFTPCLSFVIGSSNGRSPTASCCKTLESLMETSMDCTCLIVTGSIPFSLPSPINQALAISLPKACKSDGVPIQCKATGVPLPPAGPALFVPPPPKLPPPRVLPPAADSPYLPPSPTGSETSVTAPAPTPSETTPDEVPDTREKPDTPDTSASAPIVQQTPKIDSGIRPVLTPSSDSNLLTISPAAVFVLLVGVATTASSLRDVFVF